MSFIDARLAVASDKINQLLAHGRWFSPASSITKTGRHDIAESEDKHPYNVPNFLNYGIFKIKNIPIFLISS
jgi:hypothetical protein